MLTDIKRFIFISVQDLIILTGKIYSKITRTTDDLEEYNEDIAGSIKILWNFKQAMANFQGAHNTIENIKANIISKREML
ncbi:hypothetical protein [Helicobacter sp. 11S03491-1]|uniref:hypothetical protein n=1 Tax=Helicobacter sp. 11S03491-1 TaxID=1476196 RepID=UPI000BA606C1|nr:hypothetical protein [Helicobacter sp. 11S03491-1]PAF43317.1 hypothetical protein BKH45_01370 [Helicobacter sp. 11S03491-1]